MIKRNWHETKRINWRPGGPQDAEKEPTRIKFDLNGVYGCGEIEGKPERCLVFDEHHGYFAILTPYDEMCRLLDKKVEVDPVGFEEAPEEPEEGEEVSFSTVSWFRRDGVFESYPIPEDVRDAAEKCMNVALATFFDAKLAAYIESGEYGPEQAGGIVWHSNGLEFEQWFGRRLGIEVGPEEEDDDDFEVVETR